MRTGVANLAFFALFVSVAAFDAFTTSGVAIFKPFTNHPIARRGGFPANTEFTGFVSIARGIAIAAVVFRVLHIDTTPLAQHLV